MASLGRLLLIAGLVIAALGAMLVIAQRVGIPLGRLPGDIVYRGRNTTVYFPVVTMLVLSLLATLVLNFFFRR
ncbi:MAG TPA: DUF2905 domain-containing protein [Terriglobales bacterium]